ncbi:MAG: agmatine deiminase family protein [Actinomycetes bacterium]
MPPATADPPRDEGRQGPTPSSLGFRMPAEWEPHERCLIAWPTEVRGDLWGEHYLLAKASYAAVAHAIARFEPVLMLARPGEGGVARSYCGSDIEVVEMPIDDSWLRDSGPIFVARPDGALALADFAFNAWGEKYHPYDNDAAIGRRLAEHFGVERFGAPMVLEGGGITVDGQGTLITTESCLLHPSRNPGLTKHEMTQLLKDYLGVKKVIWLISGLGLDEDPDTDGHVDGVGAFVAPGRVLLHMVRDPQHPDYENLVENRRRLETTDARGREIEVVELDLRSRPVLVGDTPIVETYINSYFANGALIVPTSGTADDEPALERLREIVPDHEVVGVPCPVIGYGGGGIHCVTQQVPRAGVQPS